jgi:periplasmic divalent cation tolerance protein
MMIVPAQDVRLVLSTAGSREEAERIAHALVEGRLAACVNLIPGLTSIYRWQGAVESAEEILLLIKTRAESVDRVESLVRTLHSYDVPEFLVLGPEAASKPYLEWLLQSVRSQP